MSSTQRPQPGAWKGQHGPRILTETQRARKREKDRITKREEKLKIQNKIQTLEKTNVMSTKRIEELEAQIQALTAGRCTESSRCLSCEAAYSHSTALSMPYETNGQSVTQIRESHQPVHADAFLRSRQGRSMSDSSLSSETHGLQYFGLDHTDHEDSGAPEGEYKPLQYHAHNRQKTNADVVFLPKSRFPRLVGHITPGISASGIDQDDLDIAYL